MSCPHNNLIYKPSLHASEAGYVQRPRTQLQSAVSLIKTKTLSLPPESTYPAPLVLPEDELSYDPKDVGQTIRGWAALRSRNKVELKSGGRNVLYVVRPPKAQKQLASTMRQWQSLKLPKASQENQPQLQHLKAEDVVDYLSAFYHGLTVKLLPDEDDTELTFAPWEDEQVRPRKHSKVSTRSQLQSSTSNVPDAIALQTSREAIRIRVRKRQDDIYGVQLNLNDLLDVAREILPKDGYAILMLIEHDLYEDDDDDFACGRAYGGSRIAVVSTARYHPAADESQGVGLEHAWPASHCKSFVEAMTTELPPRAKRLKKTTASAQGRGMSKDDPILLSSPGKPNDEASLSPMQAAVSTYSTTMAGSPGPAGLRSLRDTNLWLGRVCRTASHELGHCFGIDHCVFYACSMQGTSSIQEDARQPPYICPVDLAKLREATGVGEMERYEALEGFCSRFEGGKGDLFFSSFAAWLRARLRELCASDVS